ncbi:MAG: DUF421 domain-containing protein [Leptolyngbya sp. SIO4C1]|nr:DUF421 domain-containing protein [Leptolyngbya sp. SIO4C1]
MFNSWSALFHTLIVGSLSYLALVVMLRFSGKRTLSKWNAFDFIVTIAYGSILATMLLSTSTSLTQGILGFGLLILFQFGITWLAVRSSIIQSWIKSQPALLLYRGQFQNHILRYERVTEGEVRSAIRNQGYGSLEEIEAVVIETDGSFSVIPQIGDAASAMKDVRGYPDSRESAPV